MSYPQLGTISSYSLADSVGRLVLDDGTELRFGATALHGVVPASGTRVRVGRAEPHPLGGLRALDIELAEQDPDAEKRISQFLEDAAEVQHAEDLRREKE